MGMGNILARYQNLPIQVKASFWFLMCSFLQRGISFITTPIFTRLLTPAEYGQFSVFNSWMQIVTPIILLNLYAGIYIQGLVKFEADRDRFSSSLQGLTLVLTSIWLLIYLCFEGQWNRLFSLTTMQVLAMFAIIWSNAVFAFWSANQRVDFKYRNLVILTACISIIQPMLGIFAVLHSEDKVTARIVCIAAVQMASYIGLFFVQMGGGRCFYHRRYWTYALRFNIPLLPHYLSFMVLSASDRIMIGNMCGNDKAGIYNLAYAVAQIMAIFNSSLMQTVEPWLYHKIKEQNFMDLGKVAYPTAILVAGVNLMLIMMAPEIIALFAPSAYYEAIWIVPSVAMSVYFMFLYSFFAAFEFYYERTHYVTIATVVCAMVNIGMNYICIPIFGYMAAGYTTLASYMFIAVMHYVFMRRICLEELSDVHPYNIHVIIGISGGTLMVGLLFLLLYQAPIARYGVMVAVLINACIFRNTLFTLMRKLLTLKRQKKE